MFQQVIQYLPTTRFVGMASRHARAMRMVSLIVLLSAARLVGAQVDEGPLSDTVRDPAQLADFGFRPQCTIMSAPPVSLPDPEFDQDNFRVTWQSSDNKLYVADIDPDDGRLLLGPDGRGTLVAEDLGSIAKSSNGPEWSLSSTGPQILYSVQVGQRSAIGRAQLRDGSWTSEVLPGTEGRIAPIGSFKADDPNPLMAYFRLRGDDTRYAAARVIEDPDSELTIGSNPDPRAVRFIPGSRQFVTSIPTNGTDQVFEVTFDTATLTQLTHDSGNKASCRPWEAPEFGEILFVCNVDSVSSRIYRRFPGSENWRPYNDVVLPSSKPYIETPRPFVYKGRSYVTITAKESPDLINLDTEIWIAGIDPSRPFYRQITEPEIPMTRFDTENLITRAGAMIYFSEIRWDDSSFACAPGEEPWICSSVSYRCTTGL